MTPSAAEFMSRSTESDAATWIRGLFDAIGSRRIGGTAARGGKYQCPAHGLRGEHSVSLSVRTPPDGSFGVQVTCFTGCPRVDILRVLGLTRAHLITPPPVTPAEFARATWRRGSFPPPKLAASGSLAEQGFRFESSHPYALAAEPRRIVAWKERYRHRSGAKEIRWESLNPHGQRVPGLLGRREVDMALYRSVDVLMADGAEEPLLLVESESSVDALNKAGIYATTWCGGAGSAPIGLIGQTLGHVPTVVLVPDHDPPGLECAQRIVGVLPRAALLLPAPGEDARDLLARVGRAEFASMINRRKS